MTFDRNTSCVQLFTSQSNIVEIVLRYRCTFHEDKELQTVRDFITENLNYKPLM